MATHESEIEVHPHLTLGPEDAGRFVSAREFTDADYIEPWRYEREDGRLIVMAPDGGDHVEITSPWLQHLIIYQVQHRDVVALVVPNAWVRVNDGTDRIGDIGVYLTTAGSTAKIPDRVPELMFEIVSPGRRSRERDYEVKRREYHRLGIREYVVIDRFERIVTVFRSGAMDQEVRVYSGSEAYESALLPGLRIPLAEVFRA